jgi:hypothetical protein
MSGAPERAVVRLLTGQGLAFGVMLALLIIPANALFLNAYGAKWLPATYIAIAVVGSAASALIARAARRTRLVRIATASLLALAVLYAAAWVILVTGGVWVSAPLLVLFPIALQIGFVFIGGQAGRLLDVRQMKERFPRIVTGFSAGFLLGGLLGIPLLAVFGSTKHLLLASTAAELVFVGLLLATERRFPEVRTAPARTAAVAARPSARRLFGSGLVLLLLLYQVLSAMGSWLVDYLLFNRSHAHFDGNDLTRFLSWYTAVLNLADILFLALIAGPLLKRFGLRLGLVLNPAVVAVLLVAMAGVTAGPGAGTIALFALAGIVRVADIVFTDGTTRTSVNASFQLVPVEDRVAVQAVVEGIGVPLAIGAIGVVLLALNLAGLGIGAVIAFGVVLSVVWTATGVAMYRSYTRSLADEMRRRSLADEGIAIAEDDAALHALLASDDARQVRLGLELLAGTASPTAAAALRHASDHPDHEVRVRALVRLASGGDAEAAAAASALAADLVLSADAADRRAAATALGSRGIVTAERGTLVMLLDDSDPTVRAAALDAVVAADGAQPEIVDRVVAALQGSRTTGSATGAVRRLGSPALPALRAALLRDGSAARGRLVRAAAVAEHGSDVVELALRDPDRVIVLTTLDSLHAGGAGDVVASELLDQVFDDAVAHAARSLAARASLAGRDSSLQRALDDEIDLARRLVVAVLALRHGVQVRDAVRVVDSSEGQRRALGFEALDVIISREEAAVALPLVRRDLTRDEQAAALHHVAGPTHAPDEWLADMSDDPGGVWRSSWLATCARHMAKTSI